MGNCAQQTEFDSQKPSSRSIAESSAINLEEKQQNHWKDEGDDMIQFSEDPRRKPANQDREGKYSNSNGMFDSSNNLSEWVDSTQFSRNQTDLVQNKWVEDRDTLSSKIELFSSLAHVPTTRSKLDYSKPEIQVNSRRKPPKEFLSSIEKMTLCFENKGNERRGRTTTFIKESHDRKPRYSSKRLSQPSISELGINPKSFKCLNKEQIFKDKYKIESMLSYIGHNKVYQVLDIKNNEMRVAKFIPKERVDNSRELLEEFEILKRLDHPNIVRVLEMLEDKVYYYIITEYCEGGSFVEKNDKK